MKYAELIRRVLSVMKSDSIFGDVEDRVHSESGNPQEWESKFRRYIEFLFIRDVDMKSLFSEIHHIGKFNFSDDVVRAAFIVWKLDDHYGLLLDSVSELEMKLSLMGV